MLPPDLITLNIDWVSINVNLMTGVLSLAYAGCCWVMQCMAPKPQMKSPL